MKTLSSFRCRNSIRLLAAAALAACSTTDQNPVTPLKPAQGPSTSLVANGNIAVCKVSGPAGTYHFHVDVSGGGSYTLGAGTDPSVVFDGTTASCISAAYTVVNDATWTPGLTASITITETQIPSGIQVDSIEITDGFGNTQTTVVSNPAVVIAEGVLDLHTVKFFNAALPSVACGAISAVINQPITPVTLTGSGGSGGPYSFTATGLPSGLTMSLDGTISGTPTVSGTFNYTVTVTDKNGHSGTANCSVTVLPAPTAACATITAFANVAITPVTLVGSGGAGGPYTFSAMGLPAGLTMSSSGTISGTPTASGTFNYTVTITDNAGHSGSINCSVTVAPTKTFGIGPSSMEGHLTISPNTWFNGGYSFKFVSNAHVATQFTVSAKVEIAVTCPHGGGAGGTITIPLGTRTYSVPANNTDWLPTGDQNSILSWMGAVETPDLCAGFPMDNAIGAVFTAMVNQNPTSGSLVDFRFKYRDPAAKGKTDTNCMDPLAPKRNDAATCGASWSQTVRDP